jgi:hypothetical protein
MTPRSSECPVCDERVAYGDLCPAHRVLAEQPPPEVLVKKTPPKQRHEAGHFNTPDALWVVLLFIAILILLHLLGVLELNR